MTETRDKTAGKIVVLLENAPGVPASLDCAAALAATVPASLRALHVEFDARQPWVPPEEADMRILADIEAGSSPEQRRKEIAAAFDAWKAAHPDQAALRLEDDEGDVARIVASDTDLADLVVMARPKTVDGRDALHGALFNARRLVLVVPPAPIAAPEKLLDHVLIGWKPGDHVERMVEAALPWLRKAGKITALNIRHSDRPDDDVKAAALFDRLSLKVDYVEAPMGQGSVGDTLMAEAAARGVTCLGMGAYHHGEFWEAILGGVTRDIVSKGTLPTFFMR